MFASPLVYSTDCWWRWMEFVLTPTIALLILVSKLRNCVAHHLELPVCVSELGSASMCAALVVWSGPCWSNDRMQVSATSAGFHFKIKSSVHLLILSVAYSQPGSPLAGTISLQVEGMWCLPHNVTSHPLSRDTVRPPFFESSPASQELHLE